MKIQFTKFLASFAVALVLISCSSDDNADGTPMGLELVGTWTLIEINVSAPIDADFDGTASTNILEEAACLEETIVLGDTFEWSSVAVSPGLISPITGNQYNISCSPMQDLNGDWGVSGSNLFLIGSVNRTFLINGDQLIENIALDLPGIQTFVYQRQQ